MPAVTREATKPKGFGKVGFIAPSAAVRPEKEEKSPGARFTLAVPFGRAHFSFGRTVSEAIWSGLGLLPV